MIQPTLRQLNYLLALEDEKSFSKAAEQCHVTQSTLSAGIKDLEMILGQAVVNRSRRQITLTPFGHEVTDKARDILRDVDSIMALSREHQEPLSGALRLGVIPTIAPYLLPKILPGLQEKFANLDLQLHEDLTERLLDKMAKRKLDVLLMAFPYETPGLEQKILFEEAFVLACPASMKTPKAISTSDLEADKLLLLEDGHCLRDHALSACKLQPPSQRKTFSTTSLPTLIQMVQYGYGITLLPEMAAQKAELPGNIKTVSFKNPKPTRKIGLAWHSGGTVQEDCRLLARTITQLQKS